jgi:predicted RNA-binding Zn ribbon-like protein
MVKEDFIWSGGVIWLDFVNTEFILNAQRNDLLANSGAFADWLCYSGAVPAQVMESVASWPESALELLHHDAIQLRSTLRALCEEFGHSGHLSTALISALNRYLQAPAPGLKLEQTEEGQFDLVTDWSQANSHQLLYPIAKAAAETLSSNDLERLRKCANAQCILWFLDTSKNGQRRWCSMETCGNRHKVSEHHRRKKNS